MPSLSELRMQGTGLPAETFLQSLPLEQRPIVTEAIYECCRRGWPINITHLGYLAREMHRNHLAKH